MAHIIVCLEIETYQKDYQFAADVLYDDVIHILQLVLKN